MDIDFVVVRENTGDLYAGHGGVTRKGTPYEVASGVMLYDRQMVDRCLEYAFNLTRARKKEGKPGKLTLVHKTNVVIYVFVNNIGPINGMSDKTGIVAILNTLYFQHDNLVMTRWV